MKIERMMKKEIENRVKYVFAIVDVRAKHLIPQVVFSERCQDFCFGICSQHS